MTRPFDSSSLAIPWGVALVVGLATVGVLRFWRGFFWPHAVIVGLAVAALAYSAWRTWDRMRGGA